jgi:protein-S-isoprenylcysteine O-methyltransferase Ste14
MNTITPTGEVDESSDTTEGVGWGRLLIATFIMLALPAVILFGFSGRLDWGMAWVYVGLSAAFSLGSRIIMQWKTPELIAERGLSSQIEDIKPWDKVLMPLGIIVATVMLIVAGLDKRFEWSPNLPLLLPITAFVITALGYSLGTWAILVNRFFSAYVRIQRDRKHTVVSSGPYRLIRHPGYAGTVVTSLAVPLLLGSLWSLIPAALAVYLLIIRTALEDRTLQEELEGYHDYAARVRYRLLPGVW